MDWKTNDTTEATRWADERQAASGMSDSVAAAIGTKAISMLITDPRQPDNPIVFANDTFLHLSGYSREEIIGRNCRFLQGPDTDPGIVKLLREAIESRSNLNVDILNYRKDGSPFWNALSISPVYGASGELQFYCASQLDVSDRKSSEHRMLADKDRFEQAVKERTAQLEIALEAQKALVHEVDHRVKNNLQMISSLIVMQSRAIPDPAIRESLRTMLERVEALSTVHRRLYQSDDVTRFDIADFVRDLVTDLVSGYGRDDIRTEFDLESVDIGAERAAPVALIINELVTNALKHAFTNGGGSLAVKVADCGDVVEIAIADNGVGFSADSGNKSFGTKLINSLGRQLEAEVVRAASNPGTRITIRLPADRSTHEQ